MKNMEKAPIIGFGVYILGKLPKLLSCRDLITLRLTWIYIGSVTYLGKDLKHSEIA